MYPYMDVARVVHEDRQKDMVRKAELARTMVDMPVNGVRRIAAVRQRVGAVMVRAGERVQGAQRPDVAVEAPYGPRLKVVR